MKRIGGSVLFSVTVPVRTSGAAPPAGRRLPEHPAGAAVLQDDLRP
jgi:hypothetical protein